MRNLFTWIATRNAAEAEGTQLWLRSHGTWEWISIATLCGLTGLLITWSGIYCNFHNSDSLLFAIMSTQKVTFFYWGQNRLANILPFLTSWINDIDLNLKVQIFLRATLSSFLPLFTLLILRPQAPLLTCFCTALAACLAVMDFNAIQPFWNEGQPYGQSIALFTGALITTSLLRGRSPAARLIILAIAFALIFLAMLMNSSLIIITAPLFGLLLLFSPSVQNAVLLIMSLVAYALSALISKVVGGHEYTRIIPSLDNVGAAYQGIVQGIDPGMATLLLVLSAGGLVALQTRYSLTEGERHHRLSPMVVRSLALMAATLFYFLLVSNTEWVILNKHSVRYFTPIIAIALSASGIVIVEALSGTKRRIARPLMLPATILVVVAALRATMPLAPECRFINASFNLEPAMPEIVRKVLDTDAHFVAGSYWKVWPSVFELIRVTGRRNIFGATERSLAMREEMKAQLDQSAGARLVCLEEPMERCLAHFSYALDQNHYKGIPMMDASKVIEEGVFPGGLSYRVIELRG